MTVATTGNRFSYSGDGVTKTFPFPRPFFGQASLRVILVGADGSETVQGLSADYSVEGGLELPSASWTTATGYAVDETVKHGGAFYICTAGHTSGSETEPGAGATWSTVWTLVPEENGGQVTMVTAPAVGQTLVIVRRVGMTQETDYVTGGVFSAKGHEGALDKLTLILQDLQEQIDRAPLMRESTASSAPALPEPSGLKHLRWNSAATDLENAAAVQWLSGAGVPSNSATGSDGDMYLRTDNGEVYGPKASGVWGSPVADLTGPQGPGDMQSAVYDPGGIGADAFAMENMVEGTTAKVLSDVERNKLAAVEAGADVTDAANVSAAGAVMTTGAQTISGAKTFSNAVTVEGAFSSAGIDDNATGERVQIANTNIAMGASGVAYSFRHIADDQDFTFTGGSSVSSGGVLRLFGGTHATRAGDWVLREGSTERLAWDASAANLDFKSSDVTGIGTFLATGLMTLQGSLEVVSPSTFSDVVIGAPAGNNAGVVLADETKSKRWVVFKDNVPESGSNAGSDFNIRRFSDEGVFLGSAFSLSRSTGQATFSDDVTIGGNVELGAAELTISTGSGSPEGSVAASIGSIYLRTDGGAGTSLYVKESGTGNTGWAAK